MGAGAHAAYIQDSRKLVFDLLMFIMLLHYDLQFMIKNSHYNKVFLT